MQKVVRTIGCQLFYTDTDSLVLSHPLDFCPLKTGQHLGEFTDEYPDHEILEFCSGGAKQYGLVLRRKNTSSDVELEYVLKVRGMTLNYDVINNQGLRYETFKQQVMRYARTGEIEQIRIEYPNFLQPINHTQLTLVLQDLPHSSLAFNNPPIFAALQSPHNFSYSSKLYRTQLTLLQQDLPHSSLTFNNPPIFTALQSPHNFSYSSKLYRTQLTLLQQDLPHSSLTFNNPPIFTALQSPHNFSYSSKLYRTQLTLLQQDLPHSSLTFNNPPIFTAHNSLSSNIYRIPFPYRQ
ncbi:hypothetical protein niasHT_020881 [Heterodera trifolii]|uniref:DNA-directed DNA polymerase n=1 Tax=Heterodera trifolii TaxID=157864 RepID=A0ABD2JTY8_9BILA